MQEIRRTRNISDRNYTKYMQKLRGRILSDQLAKRQEYLLQDLEMARERLLADKRQLQAIITNPKTSDNAKLDSPTLVTAPF
ncbi:MAG: hypothetical protein M3044_01315 [Thermoproteota archaeon]|nr:hypothetical protein [Thermoproteota archaeon]